MEVVDYRLESTIITAGNIYRLHLISNDLCYQHSRNELYDILYYFSHINNTCVIEMNGIQWKGL